MTVTAPPQFTLSPEQADPTGFDPPSTDASDRLLALRAMVDSKGQTLKPPRCLDYVNCCHCPVCKLREDRASNGTRRLRAA